jgi:hypothetical protein
MAVVQINDVVGATLMTYKATSADIDTSLGNTKMLLRYITKGKTCRPNENIFIL